MRTRRSGFLKLTSTESGNRQIFRVGKNHRNHSWALKTVFEAKTLRIRTEPSDFRFSQKIKGIILRLAKQCLRPELCEFAVNRQIFASAKMKTSASE